MSLQWHELLLSKLPMFDLEWSDEIKAAWWRAFDELKRMGDAAATPVDPGSQEK